MIIGTIINKLIPPYATVDTPKNANITNNEIIAV